MATGFVADQPSPHVDSPPAFSTGSLTNSAAVTLTWLNMTKQLTILASGSSMKVGVTTAGVAASSHIVLTSGQQITVDCQTKALVLEEGSGAGTVVYSVLATLSRNEAEGFDDITTANGFEKV